MTKEEFESAIRRADKSPCQQCGSRAVFCQKALTYSTIGDVFLYQDNTAVVISCGLVSPKDEYLILFPIHRLKQMTNEELSVLHVMSV